jgi:hypothetical protein
VTVDEDLDHVLTLFLSGGRRDGDPAAHRWQIVDQPPCALRDYRKPVK